MPSFGERFKELRKDKDLTQDKLGEIFSINKSSISRYEKNQQMPETESLQAFADFFKVSVDYLLGRTDINTCDDNNSFRLTVKDQRDIGKLLDLTLKMIESQDAVMLDGEVLDEEDLEILSKSIKAGLEYAKISNKKKYTPKKYKTKK